MIEDRRRARQERWRIYRLLITAVVALVAGAGCTSPGERLGGRRTVEIRHLPLDSLSALRTRSGLELDRDTSADGKGSVRITVSEPTVVRLYEMGPIDVEKARLVYQARLRTASLHGQTYLEMWCHFPGKGEFFSRGLQDALTGTTEWTTLETAFVLRSGERPDGVRLNLVVNGGGTVWIDDIRLLRSPLQ